MYLNWFYVFITLRGIAVSWIFKQVPVSILIKFLCRFVVKLFPNRCIIFYLNSNRGLWPSSFFLIRKFVMGFEIDIYLRRFLIIFWNIFITLIYFRWIFFKFTEKIWNQKHILSDLLVKLFATFDLKMNGWFQAKPIVGIPRSVWDYQRFLQHRILLPSYQILFNSFIVFIHWMFCNLNKPRAQT